MGGRSKTNNPASHKNGQITTKPKAARGKKHRTENKEKKEIQTLSFWNKSNIGYVLLVVTLGKYILLHALNHLSHNTVSCWRSFLESCRLIYHQYLWVCLHDTFRVV